MAWRYHNPVRIEFGAGAFAGLPDLIGDRRYGVVTYGEPIFQALTERLCTLAGPPSMVIEDVAANPDFQELGQQTARMAGGKQPQVWIALGGGSAIDSTKVFAAANGDFGLVRRYLETGEGADALLATPIIAVPTTAGTGSEVTCWATVWDRASGRKFSLARPELYPEWAVVDPELMVGKPRDLTVSTGLDALSHALESIWNVNANPVSASHAVMAAREAMSVLPALAGDLGNLDLRARMAFAALSAGLAFSNTKTAIAHSLSYPITLRHGAPHGIACSFTLPLVVDSVRGIGDFRGAALSRVFDGDLDGASDRLTALLAGLGVPTSPAAYGVGRQEWSEIVTDALEGERGKNFIGDKARFIETANAWANEIRDGSEQEAIGLS
ncbi:MAG: iron-containing alcohol dehydrogenase [Paracoccaceae bacterium]|nr:iron-containing alcohol dehydrogenase [Paracoccaceae bacterium]